MSIAEQARMSQEFQNEWLLGVDPTNHDLNQAPSQQAMLPFEQDITAQTAPAHQVGENQIMIPGTEHFEPVVAAAPETKERFTVRAANRVAEFMSKRSTPSEYAANKVEVGKKFGREMGAAAVDAVAAGGSLIKSEYAGAKNATVETAGRFKSFLHKKAEAAKVRKDNTVNKLKERGERTAEAAKVAGFVALGAAALGVKAGMDLDKKVLGKVDEVVIGAAQRLDAKVLDTTLRVDAAVSRNVRKGVKKVDNGFNAASDFTRATGIGAANQYHQDRAAVHNTVAKLHSIRTNRVAAKLGRVQTKLATSQGRVFHAEARAHAARAKIS